MNVGMKRKLILVAVAGLCLGAVPVLAQVIQFTGTSNAKKGVGFANPLPAGIYPLWGADVAVSCSTSSVVSSQLAAGRYVVSCGAVAWGDQGTSSVAATINAERRIPANYAYPVRVDDTTNNGYIALLCTSSTTCLISADE